MYCTGGIRCEKASAWMKHNGFNKVWHIEGGIIEYARRAREQGLPVRFIGKNFVFDERMGERISDDVSPIAISAARLRQPYQLPERWLPSAVYPVPELRREVCRLL
jgi:predicted sulfurtransferase